MKYKTICICGSMRFYDEMLHQAARLTLEGYIVLMPFANIPQHEQVTSEVKHMLDEMHRAKIDMCEEVFIVDSGRDWYSEYTYIGSSTRKEIKYALSQGKKVSYYSQLDC